LDYKPGVVVRLNQTTYPPLSFSSPKVQVHDILTPACDVWSLGCILYPLFCAIEIMWRPSEYNPDPTEEWKPGVFTRDMRLDGYGTCETFVDFKLAFGKISEDWWAKWKHRSQYYSEDGVLLPTHDGPSRFSQLEAKIAYIRACFDTDEEYACFHRWMMDIFKLDPKERLTASQVVMNLPPRWQQMENGEQGDGAA
jgi:serine/threonine protein kinase